MVMPRTESRKWGREAGLEGKEAFGQAEYEVWTSVKCPGADKLWDKSLEKEKDLNYRLKSFLQIKESWCPRMRKRGRERIRAHKWWTVEPREAILKLEVHKNLDTMKGKEKGAISVGWKFRIQWCHRRHKKSFQKDLVVDDGWWIPLYYLQMSRVFPFSTTDEVHKII